MIFILIDKKYFYSLVCEPVNCFEPPVPPDAKYTADHFTLGSKVNYTCEIGHRLVGNQTIICDIDGEWKGEIPTCVAVDCGDPEVFQK